MTILSGYSFRLYCSTVPVSCTIQLRPSPLSLRCCTRAGPAMSFVDVPPDPTPRPGTHRRSSRTPPADCATSPRSSRQSRRPSVTGGGSASTPSTTPMRSGRPRWPSSTSIPPGHPSMMASRDATGRSTADDPSVGVTCRRNPATDADLSSFGRPRVGEAACYSDWNRRSSPPAAALRQTRQGTLMLYARIVANKRRPRFIDRQG